MDKLYEVACKAMCLKCSNYTSMTVVPFGTVAGCRCGIDATKCVINHDIMKRHFKNLKENEE